MKFLGALGAVALLLAAIGVVAWLSNIGAPASGPALDPAAAAAAESGKNPEGEYVRNPFSKPGQGPAPHLEAKEREFDFGVMRFDPDPKTDGSSHVFHVTNTGDAPLTLARGPSTCQCTMSDLKDQIEVPPGGTTEITVTWKPTAPAEEFSKGASIWTNDPALFGPESESKDGKIMFIVKGAVRPSYEVEPTTFSLGTLDESQPTPFTAFAFSKVMDDLEVSVKETSSPFVTATAEKMSDEELQAHSATSGWKIVGGVEPKVSVGRVKESVTLATNDKSAPTSTLTITAHRQGPISIAGKYWNNTETVVDFRRFHTEEGIDTTLSIYAAKEETPLELKVLEKRPQELEVEIHTDAAFPDTDRERIEVHVRVPPNAPPNRLYGKEAGFVRLSTNRPDVPEIKFYVIYESIP